MIACFGEIMLRLSPVPDWHLIEQASNLKIASGGSESNVAIALSHLGNKTKMLTVLPDDIFGRKVLRNLRWHNVDTGSIVFHKQGRIGLYFTEKGSGIRGSRVFYDREHSAYNYVSKYSSQIEEWLKDCSWLHLSGIALATSRNAADFALILTKKAQKKGTKISLDINNRELLWKWCKSGTEKFKYLKQVAERSTIIMGNETDCEVGLFNQPGLSQQKVLKKLKDIAAKGVLSWVAISQRESKSADINNFGGLLYDFRTNKKTPRRYSVAPQAITRIIDRIGTGDAFCAVIIDGFVNSLGPERTLRRAVALGTLKHGISGDACLIDNNLLEKCLVDKKGRISR